MGWGPHLDMVYLVTSFETSLWCLGNAHRPQWMPDVALRAVVLRVEGWGCRPVLWTWTCPSVHVGFPGTLRHSTTNDEYVHPLQATRACPQQAVVPALRTYNQLGRKNTNT